jgi:nucleoporin NDC1
MVAFNKPAEAPVVPPAAVAADGKQRISHPPKDEPILVSTPPRKAFRAEVEKAVNHIALSPGQGSRLSPLTQKALAGARDKLLAIQKEATGSDDPASVFRQGVLKVLETPLGIPFRQEYGRLLTSTILGIPYGEPSLYINAINALTLLAVHSLAEDKYGNVQRDVSGIMRTMTAATRQLETFRNQLPRHWTDVGGDRNCPEVDSILAALKDGLGQLIQEFGPYSRDLKLSLADMRLAREAAGIVEK